MKSIECKNIKYKYPTAADWVVKNIDFSVEQGQLCSIIGPNGSGKTTLCNIMRVLAPRFFKGEFEGELFIEGKLSEEYSSGELAQKIGFVFQNPFTQISGSKKTVYEEIAVGLENLGIEEEEMKRRIDHIISLLGIEYLKDKNPFELSGGQKQRVAIASIIVMQPDILIMDEPTSQLDPQGTDEIFDIIKLLKRQGKTIVLVEHKIELIAEISDQVVVMNHGEIITKGPAKEILSRRELKKYDVRLPQYADLSFDLMDEGVKLPKAAVTIDEMCSMLGSRDCRKRVEREESYEDKN